MFGDIRDWPYLSLCIYLCDWLYSVSWFVGLLYNDATDKYNIYIYIYIYTHTHTHTKVTWFQASATILLRPALIWHVTRRSVVIQYRRFETTHQSYLQGPRIPRRTKTSWPSKMGPTGCFETPVRNCHTTVRNIPEERRSHIRKFSFMQMGMEENRLAIYIFTTPQNLAGSVISQRL